MQRGERWAVMGFEEVEAVDWRQTGIRWRPIRQPLGAEIVGMAVFTAQQPGEVVVEAHTELQDGRGQQEVYVVLRGAARFVLDGVVINAPAGTFLRVQPDVDRRATATLPGTAVLALGGESTFTPSASEWIERARVPVRSDPPRAEQIIADLRHHLPGDRGIEVGEALLAVARGDQRQARQILAALLTDAPQLREVLASDPDLHDLLPE